MRSFAFALICVLMACGKSGERAEAPGPTPEAPHGDSSAKSEPADPPAPEPRRVEFDEVVYRFQDASVPPPDHRSVTITVKDGAITRVVDSYGDELERREGTLNPEALGKLVAGFAAAGVQPKQQEEGVATAACAGGTSETVTLRQVGKEVFVGSIEHCGGSHAPDFEGDLTAFIEALKGLAGAGPDPG